MASISFIFDKNIRNRCQRNLNWSKIYCVRARTPCIFSIFDKHHFYAPRTWQNCQSGLVLPKTYQIKAKETLNDRKYTGVRGTSSYAVHFFTFSIFAKHHFYAPGSCLNCQSGLVLSKTDQTKAKETLIDRKYTGVRACTPCIFWHSYYCQTPLLCT